MLSSALFMILTIFSLTLPYPAPVLHYPVLSCPVLPCLTLPYPNLLCVHLTGPAYGPERPLEDRIGATVSESTGEISYIKSCGTYYCMNR
jgi:hypothetical protein